MTYIEWSDSSSRSVIVPWMLVSDAESAGRVASALASASYTKGLYTSITGAIEYAVPLFESNGFDGRRKVIDISGDGPNNVGGLVTGARDAAVALGITINGLPIVNDRLNPRGRMPMPNLDLYYENCVIGGPWSFIVVAEDFQSFADAVRRKLIIEIGGMDRGTVVRRHAETKKQEDLREVTVAALFGTAGWPHRPSPSLRRPIAAEHVAPPCDEGERLRQLRWQRNFEEN